MRHNAVLFSLMLGMIPALHADPLTQSNPVTNCLNNHILPQMGSTAAPVAVVNQAFLACRPFVDGWLAAMPASRHQPLKDALRQFYIDRLNAALYRRGP
jgi:hypothetical protein